MKETERLKNSSMNVITNIIIYILQTILTFVVRTIFIKKLGVELLGLDNLIINTLAVLSLTEVGLSSAISFCLYKPLAEKDDAKISSYMTFYKKLYNIIGIIVFFIGAFLSIFLNKIVGTFTYKYLYLVYFLYLFNIIFPYFISYKDILLIADQKKYKVFKYNMMTNMLMYILEIIAILYTENYILYILAIIICKLINRIFINSYITKSYDNISFKSEKGLSKEDKKVFKNNIGGIFCYQIGEYILNCTDNIIISAFINIVTVGVYTNYLSVSMMLRSLLRNAFSGITASFGNMFTTDNSEAQNNVFDIMNFICFFCSGYVTICLLNMFNPFVTLWLGKKLVLPFISVLIICINFYLACTQLPLDTVKEATGFYHKDRYVPLIQAVLNIVLSIVLCINIGFNGVIISTSISYLLTLFWNKPYVLYKYIFKRSSKKYFINQLIYIITLVVIYLICNYIINLINLKISIINLIIMGLICTAIYLIIITILFFNREEYKFLLSYFKKIIGKVGGTK